MKAVKLLFTVLIILVIILLVPGCKFAKRIELENRIDELEEQIAEARIEDETAEELIEEAEEEMPQELERTEEIAVEGEAPTISLAINSGPTLYRDVICYYRISATVTGIPTPTIEWSKDDSLGAFGSTISQVNLNRGEEYTLIATATNSSGSASGSITLTWGCDDSGSADENDTTDLVMEEDIALTDPEVTIDNLVMNAMNQCKTGDKQYNIGTFYIGDNKENKEMYCWATFVVRHLEGVHIERATIHIENITELNNASEFGPFLIEYGVYGGKLLASIPTEGGLTEIHVSNSQIRNAVQDRIDTDHHADFVFTMRLAKASSKAGYNGIPDQFIFDYGDVRVVLEY